MTLLSFTRLVIKRLPWLFIFPVLLAGLVYYLTEDLPREYQSSTTLYTGLASGTDISEIAESRIDFFAVNNAFDNIIATVKSRETIEETALKLLAQHLLQDKADLDIINQKSLERLRELVPDTLRKKLVVPGNLDSTFANVVRYRSASSDNRLADIVSNSSSHYSVTSILNRLTVNRKGNSDFLEMTFKAGDQGVCQNTLKFLVEVFQKRFKSVKGSESSNVVKYFEEQLRRALSELRVAEEKLKDFGVANRIINYDEQSKFIAESKEDMTTDYYKEVMQFGGAKAAVERLEKKMDEREFVVANNVDIVAKRKQLGELYKKLFNAQTYKAPKDVINDLQLQIDVADEELRQLAKQHLKLNFSPESVPQATLLSQWLSSVIEYEQSSARLTVFEKRLKEYDQIYDEFAPLGSEMNRLTRNVQVAESEYLSVLHGLNLAKLKQQNLQVANALTVMDEPYLPLMPLAGKRMILVIASFIVGFVLLLGFFIAQEMLDFALRTPEKAVKASGLTLAGALPVYRRRTSVKMEELEHLLTEQLVTAITIAERETEKVSTYYQVNIISARQGEGKTWLALRLANRFARIDGRVLFLHPDTSPNRDKVKIDENVTVVPYRVNGSFVETPDVQALLKDTGHSSFEFTHVFLELPYLSHNTVPYDLAAKAHLSLLVINAERTWGTAHERVTGMYQKAAKNRTMLVLNRVTPEMLEGVYGEIPKRRSILRRMVKRVLSRGAI